VTSQGKGNGEKDGTTANELSGWMEERTVRELRGDEGKRADKDEERRRTSSRNSFYSPRDYREQCPTWHRCRKKQQRRGDSPRCWLVCRVCSVRDQKEVHQETTLKKILTLWLSLGAASSLTFSPGVRPKNTGASNCNQGVLRIGRENGKEGTMELMNLSTAVKTKLASSENVVFTGTLQESR